ncbi:sensor histidine kinase [Qipengyuania atrilutea]|uniref:histidine kinase n=1 Tax=Qipengyuania atrilutea TaxID=2744473 RepID=A0A850H8T4_9SPHN|nr:HWE histidine kinase domain-containing protein [Actirhodobacter atriluteus]NVD43499.1 PAS domain S-box protein [Actirhodobacter atriluteus]
MLDVPPLDIDGLNAVLHTALDATVVMDTEGVIRGWNTIAVRDFGHAIDDVIGKRMSEVIIPPRYREAHEQGLARFLASGVGPVLGQHFEIEALHADGSELPVELSITHSTHFGEPLFIGFIRDISERRRAEKTQRIMIDELNHRVKNVLGVVSGLAQQTLRTARSLDQFGEDFTGRLGALGRSHEILTSVNWECASLKELVQAITEPYAGANSQVTITGEALLLPSKHFLALSMILYELLTNAVKYGALSESNGRLTIRWMRENDDIRLEWQEIHGNRMEKSDRRGFGTRMIEFSAKHDLQGEANWDWCDGKMVFRLDFPYPTGQ